MAIVAVALSSCNSASPSSTKSAVALRPPVITESFTHLACNQSSTMGLEGRAEARLLTADRRLDQEVRLLFNLLWTKSQKRSLVTAEDAWLVSRSADCQSESDIYQGGSIALVQYGPCEVNEDQARSANLHSHFKLLEQHASPVPAWP